MKAQRQNSEGTKEVETSYLKIVMSTIDAFSSLNLTTVH